MKWLFKRRRIILFVSLLLFTGFLLTSLLSFITSRRSMKQTIANEKLPLTSDNIYSEIQKEMLNLINTSALMASDTFVREWLMSGEEDPEKIQRYLQQIKKDNKTHSSFLVSDKTRNYYYFNGILKTISPTAFRDIWYYRIKENPDLYEINVDPDMASNDSLTIFINYKIFDFEENFLGVTGIGVNIFSLQKKMQEYRERFKSHVFFMDSKGKVVLTGTDLINRGDRVSLHKDFFPVGYPLQNQESESSEMRYKGSRAFIHKRHIPELDWNIVVLEVESDSAALYTRSLLTHILILVIISLAVVALVIMTLLNHERNLQELASIDTLTGAYNRLTFDLLLKDQMTEIKRHKQVSSLIFFDLDHFKKVNDTYSHPAGDKVIQEMVLLVSETIRESDVLCRWGGEEFAVLLKRCPLQEAREVAEKIRCTIENHPFLWQEKRINVTISLGVCECNREESVEDVMARADKALYRAKNGGRNRVSTA